MQTQLDMAILNFRECFFNRYTKCEGIALGYINEETLKCDLPFSIGLHDFSEAVLEMSILIGTVEIFQKSLDDPNRNPLTPVIQSLGTYRMKGDLYENALKSLEIFLKEPNNETVAVRIAQEFQRYQQKCKYQYKWVKMLLQNPKVISRALYQILKKEHQMNYTKDELVKMSDAILRPTEVPLFDALKLFWYLTTQDNPYKDNKNSYNYLHAILIEPSTPTQEMLHNRLKRNSAEFSILKGLLVLLELSKIDRPALEFVPDIAPIFRVSKSIVSNTTFPMPPLLDTESINIIYNTMLEDKKLLLDARKKLYPKLDEKNLVHEINKTMLGVYDALLGFDPALIKIVDASVNHPGVKFFNPIASASEKVDDTSVNSQKLENNW